MEFLARSTSSRITRRAPATDRLRGHGFCAVTAPAPCMAAEPGQCDEEARTNRERRAHGARDPTTSCTNALLRGSFESCTQGGWVRKTAVTCLSSKTLRGAERPLSCGRHGRCGEGVLLLGVSCVTDDLHLCTSRKLLRQSSQSSEKSPASTGWRWGESQG